MADIVNGQVSGYDELDTLKTVHKTILAEIKKEMSDTRNLLGEGNGFYADDTNKKITTLLDSLKDDILPSIEDAFEASEKSVESMEGVLKDNDYL